MLVHQYVYFALLSERVTAAEITARLEIEPDEVAVRGSRQKEPARPAVHKWMVSCRTPHLTVDQQIGRVVDRLIAHAGPIGELVAELDQPEGWPGASTLQVVRIFGHPDGEDEDRTSPYEGFQKLPGQHQLLGWHLDARTLDFLRLTRAELDVDEYNHD